ncbi:adenylate/guanylate cyclase domain-containing protein [Coralliovum pocilloporae]|uniref:adenylate/guanylate cyclase domain-containing protein n=1 Tax=Coralliovum pocilloporae TaxID=3066369 RepID=UPI0033074619
MPSKFIRSFLSLGWLFRPSIKTVLIGSISALVTVAVGLVLAVSLSANVSNTFSLLNQTSLLLIDNVNTRLTSRLMQAQRTVEYLSELYERDTFGINQKNAALDHILRGAIGADTSTAVLMVFDTQFRHQGLYLGEANTVVPLAPDLAVPERAKVLLKTLAVADKPIQWGGFLQAGPATFVTVAARLERDGQLGGFVVAAIPVSILAEELKAVSETTEATMLLLRDNGAVIATSGVNELLQEPGETYFGLVDRRLYKDPVLRDFDRQGDVDGFEFAAKFGVNVRRIEREKDGFLIVISTDIRGFDTQPWTVAGYLNRGQAGEEVRRLMLSFVAGLAALLAAIVVAWVLGKRISRPIRTLAENAQQVSSLELEKVDMLPRSRVREFDDQAIAFNRMVDGLRAFSTYVPRRLVHQLVGQGRHEGVQFQQRDLTIMFTDIVGFTTLSENLSALETADILNQHFSDLCQAIEQHQGTVDKFMGDGLMAFWGAPDRVDNDAVQAIAAARQIIKSVKERNKRRVAAGLPALRMRIGLHSGAVTVGNIGAPGRVNYTIVGDAVNVCQRIQDAGRSLLDGQEIAVMISEDTLEKSGITASDVQCLGTQSLRGRSAPIRLYSLQENGLETE